MAQKRDRSKEAFKKRHPKRKEGNVDYGSNERIPSTPTPHSDSIGGAGGPESERDIIKK